MNEHQRQDELQRRLGQIECPADHLAILGGEMNPRVLRACDLCGAVV